jgi:hypothetical protein
VLTVRQAGYFKNGSSPCEKQKGPLSPNRGNTSAPVSAHQDDFNQSLTSAALTGSQGSSDSSMESLPPSRLEELRELRELRYLNDIHESQITKLQRKNERTKAKLYHERIRSRYLNAYRLVLSRAVQTYADCRGIEISGEPDDHLKSVVDDLIFDAKYSYTLHQEVQQLRSERRRNNIEFNNMQKQLQLLQAEMLSRVENISVVSDEHLAREFHSLVSCVRVLSRSIRFSKDTNILDILKPCGFLVDVPTHHWEARTGKKVYIEAWIWSVLVDEIFGRPLSIFGDSGDIQGQNWVLLFGQAHFGGWPYPFNSSEKWRHMMVDKLLELAGRDIIIKGSVEPEDEKAKSSTQRHLVGHVRDKRDNVANLLGGTLSVLSTAADLTQVPKIINKAFPLALDMLLSRSRVQVTYAEAGAQFNEKEMALRDTDEEDLNNRTVAFVVRPGLTKWGDAHGRNFEQRFDIVPCEVKLETDVADGPDSMDVMP